MSGLSSPQPSSQDGQSNSSPISHEAFTQTPLHTPHSFPIDESDDFHDPFSDLHLFLAQKIKTEIDQVGSPKQWSTAIEARLLSSILPEFKQKFPKYRLGKLILKKIWEKVAYYYEKIYGIKGATHTDGYLNVPFMIRENLKSIHSLPADLPPHAYAYQTAAKIGECLATLDGKKLPIDYLTKLIWAAQKHLLHHLIPMQAKPPYEEYDGLDKLIVKALLEKISTHPLSTPQEIKTHIRTTFSLFGKIKAFSKQTKLTSTLSIILAHKLEHASHPPLAVKGILKHFIDYHMTLSQHNSILSDDSNCIELIQRLLSLYAIATHLPKNLDHQTLRSAVRYVHTLIEDQSFTSSSGMESALLVFIHAEMHLINDQKKFPSIKRLENQIIEAYAQAIALPPLDSTQHEHLERLIWIAIAEKQRTLDLLDPTMHTFFEKQLGHLMIDHPHQTFRQVISNALQLFKQAQKLPCDTVQSSPFWTTLEEKMDIWIAQNIMLCRFTHFDKKHPLFEMLINHWKTLSNGSFTPETLSLDHLVQTALTAFPNLEPFKKELSSRLWILSQYFWYAKLPASNESSYERFIKWHTSSLRLQYPTWSDQKIEKALEKLICEVVPLMPFHMHR